MLARGDVWPVLAVFAGILAIHFGSLGTAFLNDDYLFLEQARRHGLWEALRVPDGLDNHFRPVSRELWWALLTPLSRGEPLVFHLAQFAVFFTALVVLADLLRALVPDRRPAVPVLAGVLWFALLPFQRVNLVWASCSQDLIALAGVVGALALYRRGRNRAAWLAYAVATLAKSSALPLPLLLFMWSWRMDGLTPRLALARSLPFAAAALPWAIGEWTLRQHSPAPARLAFDASHLGAAFAHMVQVLAGIEHLGGWLRSWADARPSIVAFVLLAVAAGWIPDRARARADGHDAAVGVRPAAREAAWFALAWCAAFSVPIWPVAYSWSSYYYTLAAVGGAILVALATSRLARWGWILLAGGFLWWHAAGISSPAFALREDPWTGTSHVTAFYLERAAGLSRDLRTALRRAIPRPERDSRLFFATLPSWAGFQMGNGPSIRQLYRDDSLESHFYSTYGESTAARHPARFLFWNGVEFEKLYEHDPNPLFQVGGDLLLLDRPLGAAWAFRRGLEEGGDRLDLLYWLGWASLWSGRREIAERAWKEWGAVDDSLGRVYWLRRAKGSLERGDTLRARRELVEAVHNGIGHPVSHAMLGMLLQRVNAKYAMLETRVAAELDPRDWLARRDLVEALIAARLDEPAAAHLARLQAVRPDWRQDSVTARLASTLEARRPPPSGIAQFHPGGRR